MTHWNMATILRPKLGRTFLPNQYIRGHEHCFLLHDFLLELLRAAEQNRLFSETFRFRDQADKQSFDEADDVFQWFESTGRTSERAAFLRRTVFPGLLSDFLHFLYVALEASRRGNLAVTYALLRKPLQESLFLFEVIASNLAQFAERMVENPVLLYSQKAGGVQAHRDRILRILECLGDDRFDAAYLAQLRYDKHAEDGFDGMCNKAVHLVTGHPAIQTEKLNLNFIFSGWDAKVTQWSFLYSRLPYILSYAQLLVEYVFGAMHRSDGEYADYMHRRLAAAMLLSDATIVEKYRCEPLERFASATRKALEHECISTGRRCPSAEDILLMQQDGRWPGQSLAAVRFRDVRFEMSAKLSQLLSRQRH